VKVPFVLSVRAEMRIYEKMLSGAELGRRDVSPLALPTAATFAVLTRLDHPGGGQGGLLRKLHLYDRKYGTHGGATEARALRDKSPDEGMTGLSPRYVINRLSQAASNGKGCLDGLAVLDSLWVGLPQRAGFDEAERERWSALLMATQAEYDEMAKREVQKASVIDFKEGAETLARAIREDAAAWKAGSGDGSHPALRRIERLADIPQYRRDDFRSSLVASFQLKGQRGRPLHTRHPLLEEAIHRALLPSWNEVARKLDENAGMIVSNLNRSGWRKACAQQLVEYVAALRTRKRKGDESPEWS